MYSKVFKTICWTIVKAATLFMAAGPVVTGAKLPAVNFTSYKKVWSPIYTKNNKHRSEHYRSSICTYCFYNLSYSTPNALNTASSGDW